MGGVNVMSTETMVDLPEVWQDEWGDTYWCEGHIEPAVFVLACIHDMATNCARDEVYDFVKSEPLAAMVNRVQHSWARQSETDDEMMVWCDQADDAMLVTLLKL